MSDRKEYPFKVAALYKFVSLPDCGGLREPLLDFCLKYGLRGTLLLAEEGINGTVAGAPADVDALIGYLRGGNVFRGRFQDIDVKYSQAARAPFLRLKVRLKREIVTLRAPEASPAKQVGTYVNPGDWNDLISDPEILLLDTRNRYEVEIGTFEGAVDPEIDEFTAFKRFVADKLDPARHKKVAMFCTGGIRCEKASSYLLAQGFGQVFHLKGGILRYLEETPDDESLWQGDCFVFDERVAVGPGLALTGYALCHACRYPLSVEDRRHPDYIDGIQCPRCAGAKSVCERNRAVERHRQIALAKARGYAHIGADADSKRPKRRVAKHKRRTALAG